MFPVRHDLDQAVLGQAAQGLDDGVPGHAVMLGQFGHGGQPLAGLPFPGAEPSAKVVLDQVTTELNLNVAGRGNQLTPGDLAKA